jgi:hypothetical protein
LLISLIFIALQPLIFTHYLRHRPQEIVENTSSYNGSNTSLFCAYRVHSSVFPAKCTTEIEFGFPFKCWKGTRQFANADPAISLNIRPPGFGVNYIVKTIESSSAVNTRGLLSLIVNTALILIVLCLGRLSFRRGHD